MFVASLKDFSKGDEVKERKKNHLPECDAWRDSLRTCFACCKFINNLAPCLSSVELTREEDVQIVAEVTTRLWPQPRGARCPRKATIYLDKVLYGTA